MTFPLPESFKGSAGQAAPARSDREASCVPPLIERDRRSGREARLAECDAPLHWRHLRRCRRMHRRFALQLCTVRQ